MTEPSSWRAVLRRKPHGLRLTVILPLIKLERRPVS